jgi:AI-2 transport protein TqsA
MNSSAADGSGDQPTPRLPDSSTLWTIACWVVIAAGSWYLLKEFALLLRPLFLAVFLCYIFVPIHLRLKQRFPGVVSLILMVVVPVGFLYLLALVVHSSAIEFQQDLPRLANRIESIRQDVLGLVDEKLPWLIDKAPDNKKAQEQRAAQLRAVAGTVANVAADTLVEALVVGIYLLFLLMEAGRFRGRVDFAFDSQQSQQILAVVGNINRAIASYIRLKVIASLYLAIPVTVVLWSLDVKFAILWGVLTFMCNFIPYLGSIIAWSLPIAFSFLWLDPGWRPIAVAACIIAIHLIMTYLVEPNMVGRGVGLSPLVILVALSFWAQCWGLIGMFLAVPLTVMLKIILENITFTRSLARLLGDS